MNIKIVLLLTCGLLWTLAYIDCIRIGFKHKTYAMPFIALSLNVTWEIFNSIYAYSIAGFHISTIVNIIWVAFDLGILYTYFKYGNSSSKKMSNPKFYALTILVLIAATGFHYWIGLQLGMLRGGVYSGFIINLVMSVLFIDMIIKRGSTKGQTLAIAILKLFGTVAMTILTGYVGIGRLGGPDKPMLILGCIIAVVDLVYIYLFLKVKKTTTQLVG